MSVSQSLFTFEVIVLCYIMKNRKLGKHSWVVMEVSINLAHLCVNLFGSMKAFSFVSFNYHFSLSCRVRQISFQPWIICLYAVLPIFFFGRIHFDWNTETATWNLALIFPQTPFCVTQPMSISNSIYDLCVPYWHAVDFFRHFYLPSSSLIKDFSARSGNVRLNIFLKFHCYSFISIECIESGRNQINIDSVKKQ